MIALPMDKANRLDSCDQKWDDPTMATSTADSEKRIVLPDAKPGEVYDVRRETDGRYELIRLEAPDPPEKLSREASRKAIQEWPLEMELSWEELRSITREP